MKIPHCFSLLSHCRRCSLDFNKLRYDIFCPLILNLRVKVSGRMEKEQQVAKCEMIQNTRWCQCNHDFADLSNFQVYRKCAFVGF